MIDRENCDFLALRLSLADEGLPSAFAKGFGLRRKT